MNRALVNLISSSSRFVPRLYARASAATTSGHHHTPDSHGHGHGHGDSHGHGHDHGHGHHHHEPELRKTQAWRHHSGIQSKYENQSEDPSISFVQETPNYHDYRPSIGQVAVSLPYRSHAQLFPLKFYHMALVLSIWFWWYVMWRFSKESSYFFGHAYFPDPSKYTDEELGIPSDDLD